MSACPIACQCITFGAKLSDRLGQILPAVAAAGYTGAELGFRHVADTPPAELKKLLDANGLKLAAVHLGGNLEDLTQAGQERGLLATVLDYLPATGAKLVMYSGLRHENDGQFARDLAMLNRSADACAMAGMKLLYHNHNWEFAGGGRVIDALLNETTEAMGFCPDVGWVAKAGQDVIAFLDSVRERVGAMHFKDFATVEDAVDTVELGTGVAPLADVAAWMNANTPGLWAIAEQDKADRPADQAVAANAEFLRATLAR